MNYISRKIYLYYVTTGLYVLDWWERYLFNTLVLVILGFIFYNGYKAAIELYNKQGIGGFAFVFFLPLFSLAAKFGGVSYLLNKA